MRALDLAGGWSVALPAMEQPLPRSGPGSADRETELVGAQYDALQIGLERIDKPQKYLNYGYASDRARTYEERQAELCRQIGRAHV